MLQIKIKMEKEETKGIMFADEQGVKKSFQCRIWHQEVGILKINTVIGKVGSILKMSQTV